MPSYEFTGGDPIDHFVLGRIEPGDVVELDDEPSGPWKASKRRPKRTPDAEQDSDTPDAPEEI
jgi:hypothetical protein